MLIVATVASAIRRRSMRHVSGVRAHLRMPRVTDLDRLMARPCHWGGLVVFLVVAVVVLPLVRVVLMPAHGIPPACPPIDLA